jgi:hypothetical protein
MEMRTPTKLFSGILTVALALNALAQSDISLRANIIANQTHQKVEGNCGVEFVLTVNNSSRTHVMLGEDLGAALYAYTPGGNVERVGYLYLNDAIEDASAANDATNSQAYLALSSRTRVYLVQYNPTTRTITPYGAFRLPNNVNVSRVQILPQSGGGYLIVVGSAAGAIHVYPWTPGAPSAEPSTPLSIGNPSITVPLFASSVRALRLWSSGGADYLAAGGDDGMVYLMRWNGTQLTTIGKGMHHPAPIRELVVNGSRIVVAVANGQVFVWNYSPTSIAHYLTLKEPWAPLTAHSLCALPNDRVAVATAFVRVYSLEDGQQRGQQVGDYGGNFAANSFKLNPNLLFTSFVSSYIWQPYLAHRFPVRVLPNINNQSHYFVVTSPRNTSQATTWRTAFLSPPTQLSYQRTTGNSAVYSLTDLPNGLALGRVNGVLQAPGWTSRDVAQPVFALDRFTHSGATWLIGSYGVGSVFAWSGNTFIQNILPADSGTRILYAVCVLSLTGNQLTFATAGGDGKVEVWQWTIGSNTAATLLSSKSLSAPLHELSVNANRTELAVASYLVSNAWRIPLSNNQLGTPTALNPPNSQLNIRHVSYHPTNPDLLACGGLYAIWIHNRAAGTNTLVHVITPDIYHVPVPLPLTDVFMVRWVSNSELAAAYSFNGYVGVWRTDIDAVTNSKATDGTTNNWIRGGIDRAPQQIYEPHRDRIYALVPLTNELATASADGSTVRWSRAGSPVATSNYISTLGAVDFSPINGAQVLPTRVVLSDTQHALLWMNYYHFLNPVVLSPRVPNDPPPPPNLRARVLGYMTNDVLSDDVVCRYFSGNPLPNEGISSFRLEVSEDGRYAMFDRFNYNITNPPVNRAYLVIVPHTNFYNTVTSTNLSYVDFPQASGSYIVNHALSPTALRVAVSAPNNPIRIYDRSGTSWNFNIPTSTVDFNMPQFGYLKFLADDVLAVAYPHGSPSQLRLNIYQLTGTTWTLRGTIDTGLRRTWSDRRLLYFVDAVPMPSGNVRVAVVCDTGLIFYNLTRPGGVATLTEVGRSTWSANGYLDVAGHYWVRFSRYDPNILGVANGSQVVVYDLSNLFAW